MDNQPFDFGESQSGASSTDRQILKYPLDHESEGVFKLTMKKLIPEMNIVQALTLPAGSTTFDVRNSDVMSITGAAAVTIATITNGYNGQVLKLIFNDANVSIIDTSTGAKGTVNLSGSYTSSANDVLQLVSDGTSWREVSRSSGSGFIGGRAYQSGGQSISDITVTTVTIDTQDITAVGITFDAANNKYICTSAGNYLVSGCVSYQTSTDTKLYKATIQKNGSDVAAAFVQCGGTGSVSAVVTSLLSLAVNDTVNLATFHNSGLAENTLAGSAITYLSIAKQ